MRERVTFSGIGFILQPSGSPEDGEKVRYLDPLNRRISQFFDGQFRVRSAENR